MIAIRLPAWHVYVATFFLCLLYEQFARLCVLSVTFVLLSCPLEDPPHSLMLKQ